jgi:DNA-directed RNA polymerase specialized sigma24 family protein
MDYEDIQQELLCELISSAKSYDQSKGDFLHFANVVLQKKYFMLLEKYSRTKRGAKTIVLECDDSCFDSYEIFSDKIIESVDLEKLVLRLPNRYRNVISLFLNHSVPKILDITGRYRSSVYADVKRAKNILKSIYSLDEKYLAYGFNNIGVNMKNLSVIETLTAKEISSLETRDLMDLNDQIVKLTSHAKELKEKLDDALNLRFSEAVKNNLQSENKDTGTTRFFDGAFQIVAEVPKKVTWDNEKMEEIVKQIPDEKRKSLVKISYSIEERKYSMLSYEYQLLFKKARTITLGKTKFQITLGDLG